MNKAQVIQQLQEMDTYAESPPAIIREVFDRMVETEDFEKFVTVIRTAGRLVKDAAIAIVEGMEE